MSVGLYTSHSADAHVHIRCTLGTPGGTIANTLRHVVTKMDAIVRRSTYIIYYSIVVSLYDMPSIVISLHDRPHIVWAVALLKNVKKSHSYSYVISMDANIQDII